jgi:glucosamine-6-phosphate deaminase
MLARQVHRRHARASRRGQNGTAPFYVLRSDADHRAAYEKSIAEAVGSDGHVGFNEPTSSRTCIKTLTQRTRSDNARLFASENDVPHQVITMGIGTIMEAKAVLLLAFGENKACAVAGAAEGPITASNPASILQMHPDARFYLDEGASGQLVRSDYYRWVFEQKPSWQKDE